MKASHRTQYRSNRNKVPTIPGLHKKYRGTLQKAYGKHPADVPEYDENNTKR